MAAGFGTLHEVETEWSIDDVLDAHFVLDARETAAVRAAEVKS